MLVVIDTDCIGNYKSINDTIMTTTIPSIPVLPDFSFHITLFGVLTANYRKLCVRAQCKQSEIVWREHTHDVTYHLPDIFKNRSGVQKDISINISVTVEVKKIVFIVNIVRKTRFLTFLSCLFFK
jgi:hypothetical protein